MAIYAAHKDVDLDSRSARARNHHCVDHTVLLLVSLSLLLKLVADLGLHISKCVLTSMERCQSSSRRSSSRGRSRLIVAPTRWRTSHRRET